MQKETDYYNAEKIGRFLNTYGEVAGVYIAWYDRTGKVVADFACAEDEYRKIREAVPVSLCQEIIERVSGNGLEDQVIENTYVQEIKVAASALKQDGRCKAVLVYCAVIQDDLEEDNEEVEEPRLLKRRTSLPHFFKTMDVMREIGMERMKAQLAIMETEEESRKSQYSVREMAESLERTEALTEILKYLDSDKTIESIMQDFLRTTGQYLSVGTADIIRTNEEDRESVDILAQWSAEKGMPIFEKMHNQKRFSFLEGTKPIIVSSDSEFYVRLQEELENISAHAVVAMPIEIIGRINMYACFFEMGRERVWQIGELQFLSDAVRVLQNILEKRIQKNSLASSYASLEEILENVGCAIVVKNPQTQEILFENQMMKGFFENENENLGLIDALSQEAQKEGETEYYDDKKEIWYEIHHNIISWVDGRPVSLYSIFDVTEKRRYQKKIEQQAYTDFLTGLYNRMCCERDLAKTVDEAKKSRKMGALLYLDLDDFKHINDGLGHQYGDVLLKTISSSFKRVKGIEDTCYRMGGDEFVIIVPPDKAVELTRIVEDIKAIFAKPWFLKDADYYCTMSMGVVTFPEEGENVQELIKKADIAMYDAKKSGKNRVARYNDENRSVSNRRLDMEKNMRDATANGYQEFEIYYQPIIDIQKKGTPCTGAEALIRWNSAELGFISPGDFIPLAEYLGLINPIGNHVLQEACRTCKSWNENGHPEYKVNVNLSVIQLLQNNIVEIVEQTLKDTGINPRNLTLEVTESLAINDMERMKAIMSKIRQLGVRIALDDFGTGYSSLNHIREIPLDVIKVDQSFVRELVEDDYSKSFIKMVAELAGAIGVSICVEGIEKKEQYKVLEGMKVRLVQGFYFDRPMPRKEFEKKYVAKVGEKK